MVVVAMAAAVMIPLANHFAGDAERPSPAPPLHRHPLPLFLTSPARPRMAPFFSDSWLQEYHEALRISEDITLRLRERDSIVSSGGNPSRVESSTRRKITALCTCLDRLESLLQNPPEKPRLTEEELKWRQDVLSSLRLKTKHMASSFTTSPSKRVVPAHEDKDRDVEPHPVDGIEDRSLSNQGTEIVIKVKENPLLTPLLGAEKKEVDQQCTLQLWCLICSGISILVLLIWTIIRIWAKGS